MKQAAKWLIILAVVCLMLQTVAFAAVKPIATAFKAEPPPLIDGSLDEWILDSPIILDDPSQVIRDADFWQGPIDLSCTTYVMWDEDNLYLAVDVNEDTPFGAIEMLDLDGQDNFKLYISTNPSADPERTSFDTNDFLVFFIVDNQYWDTAIDRSMVDKEFRERFISKGMSGGENVLDGYECAVQMTATGFIYEAVIPWRNFSNNNIPVYTPKAGDKIKFNFVVTDISYPCPGTEYVPQMAWTGDININTDPSLWGTLIFE